VRLLAAIGPSARARLDPPPDVDELPSLHAEVDRAPDETEHEADGAALVLALARVIRRVLVSSSGSSTNAQVTL
jgi:hypothetical protein